MGLSFFIATKDQIVKINSTGGLVILTKKVNRSLPPPNARPIKIINSQINKSGKNTREKIATLFSFFRRPKPSKIKRTYGTSTYKGASSSNLAVEISNHVPNKT